MKKKDTKHKRPGWDEYFINIAKAVSLRATCLRRRYGAVITRDNIIIATGYNGAPSGARDCLQDGKCTRKELQIPHGERYELCQSVHAESNAIIRAPMGELKGANIYITGTDGVNDEECDSGPCMMCKRMILNAGIERVMYSNGNGGIRRVSPRTWLKRKV